jgi:hypothetical protein
VESYLLTATLNTRQTSSTGSFPREMLDAAKSEIKR